jgi:tRNA(fMet)-specific endonuclease VapC
MILLDTDHTTVLKFPDSPRGSQIRQRLAALPDSEVVGVAIVTVEEQMRGWLASIARERQALRQTSDIGNLAGCLSSSGSSQSPPSMTPRRSSTTN